MHQISVISRADCGVGMMLVFKDSDLGAVVVMDSDGKDSPSDVAKLMTYWDPDRTRVVVARRARRSESFFF